MNNQTNFLSAFEMFVECTSVDKDKFKKNTNFKKVHVQNELK